MNYCKGHNRFYADELCPRCVESVVAEAGRLPYRMLHPQVHPRCHRCWNLSPFCHCDGWMFVEPELPELVLDM